MPRALRHTPGGYVYHVLNRANGRLRLFKKDDDFLAFERVLLAAQQRTDIPLLAWCLMSNHWHIVTYPARDGQLTDFVSWLTLTHAQRWKQAHAAVGQGHLYQGRFKSFPIEADEHLLTVLRCVERNPVRAGICRRAQDWRWSSLHVRQTPGHELRSVAMAPWPVSRRRDWVDWVNTPQTPAEELALKRHIARGTPLGGEAWVKRTAKSLALQQTLRPRGRQPGWRKKKTVVKSGIRS